MSENNNYSLDKEVTREYEVRLFGGQVATVAVGGAAALGLIASGVFRTPVAQSAIESIVSSLPSSGYLVSLSNPLFQGLPIVAGFCAVNDSPEAAAITGGAAVAWSLYNAIEAYSWGGIGLKGAMYAFTASLFPIAVGVTIGGILGLCYVGLRKLFRSRGNYEKRKKILRSKKDK